MSNLNKTKKRINSIISTRKITSSMQLVASIKFKRYKKIIDNQNEYLNELKDAVSKIYSNLDKDNFELQNLFNNDSNKNLYIIVNSNLGLCSYYNSELFKFLKGKINKNDECLIIGNKALSYYKKDSYKINDKYIDITNNLDSLAIDKFTNYIYQKFMNKEYKNIYIAYTEFINSLTFKPNLFRLLPIDFDKNQDSNLLSPHIEPNPFEIFKKVLPLYLSNVVLNKLSISLLSEQALRRMAMDNATSNADELIDKLKLIYNKARQSNITQEINEVVSGANNLS